MGRRMGETTPAASEQRAAASIDRSELERGEGTDGGEEKGLIWRDAEYPEGEPGGFEQNRVGPRELPLRALKEARRSPSGRGGKMSRYSGRRIEATSPRRIVCSMDTPALNEPARRSVLGTGTDRELWAAPRRWTESLATNSARGRRASGRNSAGQGRQVVSRGL